MSRDRLVVLGATGSTGRQTLDIASNRGMQVVGWAARSGSDGLAHEIAAFHGAWAFSRSQRSSNGVSNRFPRSSPPPSRR